MREIVLATSNKNKIKEIIHFFKDIDIKFLSLAEFSNVPEVVEDGQTLEENAIKKAREIMVYTRHDCLADDSGLEVDYLNGAPGVYSARFAGEDVSYEDNNKKLLKLLQGVPREKRTARFRTVIAIVDRSGDVNTVEGICEGIILEESRGENGFGYDPIFFIPGLDKTLAELTLDEKNKISHRSKALALAHDVLKNMHCEF